MSDHNHGMTDEQYLIALVQSNSADEILSTQADYEESNGLHLQPIGGIENNSYSMENMEKVTRAHNETITNGFDSLIQLHQHRHSFKSNPQTPSEAQDEIAAGGMKADGVYVYTSTPPNRHSSRGGRPKHLANVMTIDEGIAIRGTKFGETIMSIGGSNKVSNPLSMGTYGQGCKAILGFSNKGVALIYSRPADDPDHIYFTVTSMVERPGWKAASYQWQHDGSGSALKARVALLPPEILVSPRDIDADSVIKFAQDRLIIGDHGLAFKTFELADFSSPMVVYNQFRENNFGVMIPLRYRNGVSKNAWRQYTTYKEGDLVQVDGTVYQCTEAHPSKSGKGGKFDPTNWKVYVPKNIYNIKGLRERLLANRKRDYPVVWSEIDVPILFDEDGRAQATISSWYIEERKGKVKKTHDNLDKPIYSMLSKSRWHTPIFVTMHGQTHLTLPILTRLRSAGLPYLDGHLIVEIRCDNMDPEYKRQMFTSNREGAKEGMRDRLNEEIEAYFSDRGEVGGQLRNYHDALRSAAASKDVDPADKMDHIKRFLKLMRNPLAGSLFTSMGFGGANRRSRKPNDPNGPKKPVFIGKAVPDKVSVVGEITFEPGQKRFLSVATNALDAFDKPVVRANGEEDHSITLDLPPFLRILTRMPIDNGRVSFRVECDENAKYTTTGEIVGRVDRSTAGLPPLESRGKVVVAKEREVKDKKGKNPSVLNPKLSAVDGREDSRWGGMQAPDGAKTRDVAFSWEKIGGDVEIFWNTQFGPYVSTLDAIQLKWRKETGLVERFKADYQMAIQFLAFAEIDAGLEAPTAEESERRHALRAAAAKVQSFMLYSGLHAALGSSKRRKDVEVVIEEEAVASTADKEESLAA